MRLYFLRHADARPGADDAARPLSPAGRKEARRIGRFLQRAGVRFDAAYSSPLVRARQTAALVLEVTGGPAAEATGVAAALGNAAEEFPGWLRSLPAADHILLVGHAPSLAERLCGFLGVADPERLKLPKGGLACVETEDRRVGRLRFLVSPKVV
jgi:phosphohistidine phosphatase